MDGCGAGAREADPFGDTFQAADYDEFEAETSARYENFPGEKDIHVGRMLRRTEPTRRSSQELGIRLAYSESTRDHAGTVTDANSDG